MLEKEKKKKKKKEKDIYIKWVYLGPQKVEGNKISCSLVECSLSSVLGS